MEITSLYQKTRREFGRAVNTFSTTEPESLGSWPSDAKIKANYVERDPAILELQAIPEMSEHEVNTERFAYVTHGMLHTEGGWPKDIDCAEKEQTTRYRKKVEKDEEYIRQVKALGEGVEHSIMQNSAIDIYQVSDCGTPHSTHSPPSRHPSQPRLSPLTCCCCACVPCHEYLPWLYLPWQEYFAGEYADHSSEPPSAKTLSVFKDPAEVKRTVCSISWYPDGGKKLAVAFAIMQFQDWRMDGMSSLSYIWDVTNPNTPEMELQPSSALCCLEYNPKDPHLLVGGSYNGLISYWDTRKGCNPADTSIIEKSHRDPVYAIAWLQGKTAFECASTSTDGQVLWWDIRKLGEPSEKLILEDKNSPDNRPMGGVCLEYSAAAGPTKFLVGTEQGSVVSCNRKAKNPADRIGTVCEGH